MTETAQRVFVIEDDPIQGMLYERILTAGIYDAKLFSDGRDFLAARASLAPPHLILVDLVLPGPDGVQIIEQLLTDPVWCTLPVVLMSASPTKERVIAAQRLPVPPEGYLVKPVDARTMLRVVRGVVEGEEPALHLKGLQRQRLALSLELEREARAAQTVPAPARGAADLAELLGRIRQQVQQTRMMEAKLPESATEVRRGLAERIRTLEAEAASLRRLVSDGQREVGGAINRRQEAARMQKALRDLDAQILAFTTAMKKGGSSGAVSRPNGPKPAPAPSDGNVPELVIHAVPDLDS